jgi:hypothetical protein
MHLPLLLVVVVPVTVTPFRVRGGFQPQAQYELTLWTRWFSHRQEYFRSNCLPDAENLSGTEDE